MDFLMTMAVFPGRGPQEISSIINLRDGNFRTQSSSKKFHFANRVDTLAITERLIASGWTGQPLDKRIKDLSIRSCSISSFHEQLPHPDNRITLSPTLKDPLGIPRPVVHYSLNDYEKRSIEKTIKSYEKIAKILGAIQVSHVPGIKLSNHIMGSTLMGNQPKTSVVDRQCRTHDHPNLFIAGSSVFPSSACVNPTLTIVALSFMISDTLKNELFF
jgi:choline dehydrogenase-like flavoprotein